MSDAALVVRVVPSAGSDGWNVFNIHESKYRYKIRLFLHLLNGQTENIISPQLNCLAEDLCI